MIVSASRRTDIPAFYGDWMLARLEAGEALVRNPMNARQVSRIDLRPEAVDMIVFWTKNAAPFLPRLREIDSMEYSYCFQYTYTAYGSGIEPGLDREQALRALLGLSDRIGPGRLIWRYDPILFSDGMDAAYHADVFSGLCRLLAGRVKKCVISFVDMYAKVRTNASDLICAPDAAQMRAIAERFAQIAGHAGIPIFACSEALDLAESGVRPGACIDAADIGEMLGVPIRAAKERNQRPLCRCIQSVEIGAYDTCAHGCAYCYANASRARVDANRLQHDPRSPMLIGWPKDEDTITERRIRRVIR